MCIFRELFAAIQRPNYHYCFSCCSISSNLWGRPTTTTRVCIFLIYALLLHVFILFLRYTIVSCKRNKIILPIIYLLKLESHKNFVYFRKKTPRFRLWTFPVLVDGPLGVVSADELIGIILFIVFVIWDVYVYTAVILGTLTDDMDPLRSVVRYFVGLGVTKVFFAEWVLLCLWLYCIAFK